MFKGVRLIMAVNYYTQEGLDKLKAELNELKTKGRADMAKQIAEARDKGDLSENAEYDAAKEAQGLLELKISKLEKVVGDARVIDESSIDTSKVSILSTVKIKNKKNNMEVTYQLVAEEEADLKNGKISVQFGKFLATLDTFSMSSTVSCTSKEKIIGTIGAHSVIERENGETCIKV